MSLATIIAAILADNVIDAEEVTQLRAEIMEDGVVDADEVKALFELNDATDCEANHPSFKDLFVEGIASNVMADGTIDDDEVNMLVSAIGADGQVDANELELLTVLKEQNDGVLPAALEALLPQ